MLLAMLGSKMARNLLRESPFIETGPIRTYAKSLHGAVELPCHRSDNDTRIDPARKQSSDRDIAYKVDSNSLVDPFTKLNNPI
jgi:hypothetical protein